jgi:GT2 family glycosyltransferase
VVNDSPCTTFAPVQLSIIIVNYNVKYFLEQCLHSVQAALQNLSAEVIVVDNASTDGSNAYLPPLFPWVKWIANAQNTGFGVANNQAVAIAQGEYVLFLNPDTLLPEDCLERCLSFLQAHPQAGALGIRMLDGSGQYLPESKRGFPAPLTSLFKLSGLAGTFPHSKLFARYYMGHLSERENHPVEVLAGAFMLVRRQVLQQTGAFDERFFMYGEDIDLSYRIRQAGWQNWYFAESNIIHFKGESTKKGSLNYVRMFYQAMSLFVQKHYSSGGALLYRWLIEAAIWGRAGVSVVASLKKSQSSGKKATAGVIGKQRLVVHSTAFSGVQIITTLLGSQEGCMTAVAFDEQNPLAGENGLAHLLNGENQIQEVIFCLDDCLTMKKAVQLVDQHPKLRYAFHYAGSYSLVSSGSKHTGGEWLVVSSKP